MLQVRIGSGDIARFRPRFRLDPPRTPFLGKLPVSIRLGHGIDAEWLLSEPEKSDAPSNHILDDVISRISREVQRYPRSVRARVNLATALLNAGQTDESGEQLEQALRLEPTDYLTRLTLARARIAQGRLDQAEEIYKDLLDVATSKDPSPLMGLAYVAIQRKSFSVATEVLRRLTSFRSTEVMARYHLATILMDQGHYREAISNLRQASRAEVRSPAIYEALGVAYASCGDWARASRSLSTALALAPGTAETIRAISQIAAEQGHHTQAILLLNDLVVGFPKDSYAKEILAHSYLALRQFSKAKEQFQSVIELLELNEHEKSVAAARVANNLGVCLYYLDDVDGAKSWYRYAINARDDALSMPYNNLARICLQSDEVSEALELVEACSQRFPNDRDTRLTRAYCFLALNKVQEASDELSAVIDKGDGTAEFYSTLGFVQADRKRDFAGALAILRKGHERFPADSLLVNNLAYVNLMLGRAGDARHVLESIKVENAEESTKVALTATWGLLYLWEGNIENGRSEYRRAEELASQLSNRRLGRRVKQKMHLELARAYLRRDQTGQALVEISNGLAIGDRTEYREDLETLNQRILSSAAATVVRRPNR